METNLKKLIPMLGIFTLAMTSVMADDCGDDSCSTSCCDRPMEYLNTPNGIPPGALGMGCDDPSIFIDAAYTLWTARQAGLVYTTSNYYSPAVATASTATGSAHEPKMHLRSGFKVGLGANLHHDGWDMQLEYTWFWNNNNSKDTAHFTAGRGVTSLGGVVLNSASASWNNWFNRLDLTMARSFFAGHYLVYRPYIGLLGTWDFQQLDVDFVTTAASTQTVNWKGKQNNWGIGPYAGVDSSFYLTSEWAIFGNLGAANPWAQSTVNENEHNNTTNTTIYHSNGQRVWNVEPMLELALGLRWDSWWCDNSWHFRLQAAWEQQVYLSHNKLQSPASVGYNSSFGDYSMQGLTVKAVALF